MNNELFSSLYHIVLLYPYISAAYLSQLSILSGAVAPV